MCTWNVHAFCVGPKRKKRTRHKKKYDERHKHKPTTIAGFHPDHGARPRGAAQRLLLLRAAKRQRQVHIYVYIYI